MRWVYILVQLRRTEYSVPGTTSTMTGTWYSNTDQIQYCSGTGMYIYHGIPEFQPAPLLVYRNYIPGDTLYEHPTNSTSSSRARAR